MARGMQGAGRGRWALRGALVAGAATVGLVTGVAGGAWGGTLTPPPANDATCAVAADDAAPVQCFDTTAEAVEFVTGEKITDPAALHDNRAALEKVINAHNARLAARAAAQGPLIGSPATESPSVGDGSALMSRAAVPSAASMSEFDGLPVLGAVWKDKNYTGKSAVMYAAAGPGCGTGSTYGFPHTGDFGMQDNITSLATYSGCAVTAYKDANYKGTNKTIQVATVNIGSPLNDEISSLVFRPRS